MSTGKPGRGSDQFPLRFPDGMRDRIKAEADKNGRSMNAEIVARLEDSFALDEVTDFPGFTGSDRVLMMHHELEKARAAIELSIPISPSLYERIKIKADRTGRTVAAEGARVLEETFPLPEDFSLDVFIEQWLPKIFAAPDRDKAQLVADANLYLVGHEQPYSVSLEKNPDGKDSIMLTLRP